MNQQYENQRTTLPRWAFAILSAVGRILVPLEQKRRRLPGRWPQVIATLMLVIFILLLYVWRSWLGHQMYRLP